MVERLLLTLSEVRTSSRGVTAGVERTSLSPILANIIGSIMTRAHLLAIALTLAAPAPAADVILTITANVRSVNPNPTSGPFVGTVPNTPVTLRVGLGYPFPPPSGGSTVDHFDFDIAQTSLEIGGVNAALFPWRLSIKDHPTGDRLRFEGSVGSSYLRCVIDDPSGAWLASPDLLGLLGTSSLSGLQVIQFELPGNGGLIEFDPRSITVSLVTVGASFCPAPAPNSSGALGRLTAFGLAEVSESSLNLRASSLPPGALGMFLCSRTPGPSTAPTFPYPLCLGGSIGRFVALARSADPSGVITAALDLRSFPQPAQPVAVQAGETWYFQAWHRDSGPGVPSSGLTDGVALTFL